MQPTCVRRPLSVYLRLGFTKARGELNKPHFILSKVPQTLSFSSRLPLDESKTANMWTGFFSGGWGGYRMNSLCFLSL